MVRMQDKYRKFVAVGVALSLVVLSEGKGIGQTIPIALSQFIETARTIVLGVEGLAEMNDSSCGNESFRLWAPSIREENCF